ncbi:hypothetical protein [Elizabethkingia anophelis]|uniref:hypothetical protein n=1 Tax=Elizabethkingia anophelis TaxID=1117645 RepID=UPI000C6C89DC|nr:hypothetical protein [Elizabethkingia anophelis]PKR31388.1 hypothetical protein CWH99_11495 [Elizabethkingia anophelis]PKR34623.1 hypothetical protein CWI00_07965 [Elizabethkingia anophelis]PRQ81788.1 hypothetical protein CMT60_01485 [Elizabethkingia anophelis]PRQ83805.1 hypothetical protein CMT87_10345 [Elizabethkingia anophelis]PRQ87882.1 hypothetical protein CMT86_08180 [Elizabethkingia anophelis]
MRKNICIIDDSLPVVDYPEFINSAKLIDESALKFLCSQHSEWPEEPLKGLINEIISSHADWGINAFHTPTFYFNHIEEEIYSPEIIIFDWDYAGESEATDVHLYRVLSTSYSVVGIFTGADRKDEIEKIINNDPFKKYSDRIHLVEKGEENAIAKIINEVNQKFESHFSYKFGQELKYNSVKSLDEILVSISKLSYDEFICAFGHKSEDGNTDITIKEFVEIISEKFKNHLSNIKFTEEEIKPVDCSGISVDDISKLWSYRMYYSPIDDLVRTGDIITLKDYDKHTKFLVISANCHLRQFWKKNFGNLALVPLYEKSNDNNNVKNKLVLFKSLGDYNKANATSISNEWTHDALSIVASVPVPNEHSQIEYKDYIIFPKEIITINIPPPIEIKDDNLGKIRNLKLNYSDSDMLISKNRININEPFRTPLIQFALNNITGYGAPDYPASLQGVIKSIKLEK